MTRHPTYARASALSRRVIPDKVLALITGNRLFFKLGFIGLDFGVGDSSGSSSRRWLLFDRQGEVKRFSEFQHYEIGGVP